MKGIEEDLMTQVPALASVDVALGRSKAHVSSSELKNFCKLQLEQLATQLPLIEARLVYQDLLLPQLQTITYRPQELLSGEPVLSCRQLTVRSLDWLPLLRLTELSTIRNDYPYICALSHGHSSPEYLLLWTSTLLSESEKRSAERQAQVLCSYLAVHRECARQRAEMQILEQVVQRVEHQLRNPLALISLYAETLRLTLPTGTLQDQAGLIRDTVGELSSTLAELMHCGRQASLRLDLHDLRATLIETIRGLEPWLDQKQLQIIYPEGALVLPFDPWQIKQVLHNLLSNAIHFSPQAGKITCHWQVFRDEVLIEIRDQGAGLSESDLQKAFTPFYSRRPGGTGLGLSIAKKIVLDHRGSIWVQNLPEGGAQFSMIFPRQLPGSA